MKKGSLLTTMMFIGAGVIALAGIYWAAQEAYRYKRIESEIEALKQQANKMRNENDVLQKKIAYFQTAEFQEKIAKEKLNLQKPEEEVVVVKPSVVSEEIVEQKPQDMIEQTSDSPNYIKWWNQFFK